MAPQYVGFFWVFFPVGPPPFGKNSPNWEKKFSHRGGGGPFET